jgi:hypothetical protein
MWQMPSAWAITGIRVWLRAGVDVMGGEHFMGHRTEGTVAGAGLATALQGHRVSALPGQAGDLHQGIGAGFEHHPQHPQRAVHALENQPMVERPMDGGAADQLRHVRKLADAVDGRVELLVVEKQALDQGRAQATGRLFFAGARHVLGVRLKHGLARIGAGQSRGQVHEQTAPLGSIQRRQPPSRGARRYQAFS